MKNNHKHPSEPSPFLVENLALLPPGRALDIAMGAGRHAVYLALHGFTVTGIDNSPEAVAAARASAAAAGVEIEAIVADLESGCSLAENAFDLVACFNYLHRPLFPEIRRAVRPGGVVVYETYTIEQVQFGRPSNPDFLLEQDELLRLFSGFEVIRYYEGILKPGEATAGIIARKPREEK